MKKLISLAVAAVLAMTVLSGCGSLPSISDAMGSNDGTVYQSDATGLKFTVSGNWRFMTEDEIEQITGVTQDILDEAGEDADVSSQAYAMMAMDETTGNNVNVMVQVIADASGIDMDELLNQTEKEIESMGNSIGMTYTFSDHSTAKLSGIEFHKITANADFSGVSYVQGCYIAFVNNVCVNATITSYDGTPLEDIEAMFN